MLGSIDEADMVYYVVYRASKELKNRSQIARQLHALDCKPIQRSFWKVDDNKIGSVTRIFQQSRPIILKRQREVERPRFTKEGTISEIGSQIVIAYKGSKKQRTKINVLLRSAPCIRLCRGVYAFSQWQQYFDKEQELIDAKRFWNLIREVDENAIAIPRLVIVNSESIERILKETKKRLEMEIEYIIKGYRSLYQKIKQGEGDREAIWNTARKLRKRFVTIKKMGKFYEKWLKINSSNLLIKPYLTIRKVYSLLNEKYETGTTDGELTSSVSQLAS